MHPPAAFTAGTTTWWVGEAARLLCCFGCWDRTASALLLFFAHFTRHTHMGLFVRIAQVVRWLRPTLVAHLLRQGFATLYSGAPPLP